MNGFGIGEITQFNAWRGPRRLPRGAESLGCILNSEQVISRGRSEERTFYRKEQCTGKHRAWDVFTHSRVGISSPPK